MSAETISWNGMLLHVFPAKEPGSCDGCDCLMRASCPGITKGNRPSLFPCVIEGKILKIEALPC